MSQNGFPLQGDSDSPTNTLIYKKDPLGKHSIPKHVPEADNLNESERGPVVFCKHAVYGHI